MDQMLDCRINQEYYDILNQERDNLDTFESVGVLRNIDMFWLKSAANITQIIFSAPRPNIACGECVKQMIRPLLHQLRSYEALHNIKR